MIERIEHLKSIAPRLTSDVEAIAARRLYSTLAELEYIAVLAAKRGNGTEGQLEDELVHRGVFLALARDLGGVCPPNKETVDLVDRLSSMTGPKSLLLLNIVAETWLDTVFDCLGHSGWGSELFKAIEADEARHVKDAWLEEIPNVDDVLEELSDIEHALAHIALSLAFILPIRYLKGDTFCGDMGLSVIKSHESVCKRLGTEPGKVIGKLKSFCRGIRMMHQPVEIEPIAGRLSLMRASPVPFVMDSIITIPRCPMIPLAAVVSACSELLYRCPELNRVMRGDRLYQHRSPSVFVRVRLDTGIRSIWLKEPRAFTERKVYQQIKKQRDRLRGRKHYPLPPLGDMEPVLPPAQAAIAVTDISEWGFDNGSTPLVPAEGVPIVITLGMAVRGEKMVISFSLDHRVFDASDMGLVKRHLMEILS